MANGPSLRLVTAKFLNSMPSIATNHYYMRPGFKPWYYVNTDIYNLEKPEQREWMLPYIKAVKKAFINERWAGYFDNVWPLKRNPGTYKRQFSENPLESFGNYANVTYVSVQIAFHLGFDPCLIVGLDLDYNTHGKHFYADDAIPELAMFNNAPVGPPHVWFEKANDSFGMAREVFERHGRRIINLSPWTKCEALERGELDAYT